MKVSEHFDHFRKRPGMYMGAADINLLEQWVIATSFVEDLHGIPIADRFFPVNLSLFETWVAKTVGLSSARSFGLAREHENPFGKWFEWYDRYVEETESRDLYV